MANETAKRQPAQARRTRPSAALRALALLALGLTAVGCGEPSEPAAAPGRVLLIGIDGASPRLTDALLAEGRLPNLAALAGAGVSGSIRSEKPLDSPRIWNTIATGKLADKHGIHHFAKPSADGGKDLYLSSDRKTHALWNIVSDAGMSVGVVNFWNTYPPEIIHGVMVSDHLLARNIEGRRKLTHSGEVPVGPVIHPAEWHERLARLLAARDPLTGFTNPLRENEELPRYLVLVGDDLPRRFDEDGMLTRIALEIEATTKPRLLMLLLPGIDRVSHFLWGSLEDQSLYAEELRLSERERAGGAAALRLYYEYTDALIGLLVQGHGPEDLVLVVSDHGFEAGRGMGLLTGVHESDAALDGVVFARGRGIARGTRAESFSIRDVTPTILAWLGLPLGADMDGRPVAFLAHGPLATIPSHDITPVERMPLRPSGAEEEIVDQLRSLGYLE